MDPSPPTISASSPRSTKSADLKKIYFILLLIYQFSQVTACGPGKYEHNGVCCSLCSADLGLQIKEVCTKIHNTTCEPRKGYYCIENCQMAKKHTTCPPGQGVKEKGTPLNDTVCEKCPVGTFSGSDSSMEACKNWTLCEKLNLQLDKHGSSEADVKCAENYNLRLIISVVAIVVIVLILTVAVVFWRYPELRPRFYKRRENGIGRGDRPSPIWNNINGHPSDSTTMPLRSNEQP
ncbi:tumor necrosis factor receptor superfamily member 5-like isoform X1 [Leucoraja erinacea]|uniref:tumor necrosis factor receptor superfamily member 5-like isoform X1 n=1 Tax=Leucoraja erinaceus TaxID=7782 RepID=UPI0024577B75|nr:tumor necrosis factor receptor superfamily member 5-like isoform X1 [Leucoraja erinacea]